MIVQPDFADHWKTEMLIRLVGSEAAVRCVLRFWSHCQNRKQWKFRNMTPAILSSVCKWSGDADEFFDAMSKTFLEVDGDTVTAHEWKEVNARLLHNWKAGEKGGRPKKPLGSPRVSLGKPKGASDKIREDGVDGEEKIDTLPLEEKCERIYSAYPRREAKPKALPAIAKALEKATFEDLLSLTIRYAKSREGQPLKYTPMPATWFNQERYNDDPQLWAGDRPQDNEPKLEDWTERLGTDHTQDRFAAFRAEMETET